MTVVPAVFQDPAIPEIATTDMDWCVVCGGRAFSRLAEGFDYEILSCRNIWRFWRCDACGHNQINPRPADAALPIIYPPHYYSYDMQKSVGAVAMAGKRLLDLLKFRGFLGLLGREVRAYIDIGCGDMKYLDLMHRRGVPGENLHGLELSDAVAAEGRTRGYRVFNARVETATAVPENSFDLATMFHVIEHVDDPAAVVRKVASWLKPGGFLVLETPNFESLDARLFRRGFWGGYHFPRHWHIFTRASLSRLLEQNGFAVKRVSYQPGHSFWLYSFHHALRFGPRPLPRLARLFHPLKSLPMLMLATAFDLLRARLGFRTSAMLVVAQRRADAAQPE